MPPGATSARATLRARALDGRECWLGGALTAKPVRGRSVSLRNGGSRRQLPSNTTVGIAIDGWPRLRRRPPTTAPRDRVLLESVQAALRVAAGHDMTARNHPAMIHMGCLRIRVRSRLAQVSSGSTKIRPVVVTRKAALFAGSVSTGEGARRRSAPRVQVPNETGGFPKAAAPQPAIQRNREALAQAHQTVAPVQSSEAEGGAVARRASPKWPSGRPISGSLALVQLRYASRVVVARPLGAAAALYALHPGRPPGLYLAPRPAPGANHS